MKSFALFFERNGKIGNHSFRQKLLSIKSELLKSLVDLMVEILFQRIIKNQKQFCY